MFSKKEEPSTATTAEIAPEFPKKGQSGGGTEEAYSVEARFMYNEPKQFGAQIFDQRWKTVLFDRVSPPLGVQHGPPSRSGARAVCGLYGYQAAQALRWWFHANAAAGWQDTCLETRLVRHRLKYEFSSEAVSAHVQIGGDDRSGRMPDYGTKNAAPDDRGKDG